MSPRILPNTVAVLVTTLFTTLVVYAIVSSVDIPSTLAANADTTGTELVCPATGCSAVSCHATAGTTAADAGSSATSDSELQTCPATGCTSYGCHATDGSEMPGGGGRGFGHGRSEQTYQESGLET